MVIFREHRGGLSESLETAREFENFDDMFFIVDNEHNS